MAFTPLIGHLVEAFRCLPGVGPKSAQRMAFYILERDRPGGQRLATAIELAVEKVGNCESCRTLSETALCALCANPSRDPKTLCIVENPADVVAVERTAAYSGLYYVLMGHLSPLDGIGPTELGLDALDRRLAEGVIEEMIIATNPTVEGEATAHYLAQMAGDYDISATRIAHGVPMGGELEYIDGETLTHALAGRQKV